MAKVAHIKTEHVYVIQHTEQYPQTDFCSVGALFHCSTVCPK